MERCSKCAGMNCVKDGVVKGKQRYLCKECGYRHTVPFRGKSPTLKRQALELYLEGLGFRSIGRFLKCSHVAVYHWIKAYGESIETIRSASGVDIIEMDEMHTYIGTKKTFAGFGLLLIEMQSNSSTASWVPATAKPASNCGRSSSRTGSKVS